MAAAAYTIVDSAKSLTTLLRAMHKVSKRADPCIAVDLEGARLSRRGTVSLMNIFDPETRHTYLADIHTLKADTFATSLPTPETSMSTDAVPDTPWTLKTVLESPTITKLFFDLRRDSDALHGIFDIHIKGVEDVQLMEVAARPPGSSRHRLLGLQQCIELAGIVPAAQAAESRALKELGQKAFDPKHGGTYDVFTTRPLNPDMALYCANDVRYLHVLRRFFWKRMTPQWKTRVADETAERIALSQSATWQPHSPKNANSPWRFFH